MTTTTNDTGLSPAAAAFVPTEEWIDAFEQQCTHELRKKAKRFARSRASFVARAGGRVDDDYESALVQDAFTDTLFGSLTWDPAAATLEQHVLSAIRSRTKDDRLRAKRFRHQSIDAFDARMDGSAIMAEVESSLALDHVSASAESTTFAHEVIDQVRNLAGTDKPILRVLDAIEAGAAEPAEIMSVAKMSEKVFKKARLRMARIVEQLNNSVLTGARTHA